MNFKDDFNQRPCVKTIFESKPAVIDFSIVMEGIEISETD